MSGYVLGADAEADLDGIWEYIALDEIAATDRWIAELFNAFVEGRGSIRLQT